MKKKKINILTYINDNKFYIISFIFAFLILFFIMNYVTMYADDFTLLNQSDKPFGELLKYFVDHYFGWGGGYTPALVIFLFRFGNFNLWKIINTFIITLMLFIISKLLSKNKKQFIINFIISWLLFFCISINIARECIYWLDGSMAYVISTFETFMFVYLLYTRFVLKKDKKYDLFILPLAAFFSGWSGAQTSAVTLILTILFIIWYVFIKHNKVNKKFVLFCIASFLGSAIFFLSPGNGVRMDVFADFARLNIIDKALTRSAETVNLTFNYNQYSLGGMPLFIYIFSYLILFLSINQVKKSKNKKEKSIAIISTIIQVLFLAASIAINYMSTDTLYRYTFNFANLYQLKISNQLYLVNFIPYFVVIIFLISNFITIVIHSKEQNNILLLILFIIIYGSQYSMLFAPYTPLRTCLTSLIFLIFAIVYLIKYLNEQDTNYSDIVPIILMYINLNLAIITYIFINIFAKDIKLKKITSILLLIPITYIALCNYHNLYVNYKDNKIIYNENIDKLKNYKKGDKVIYLKRPKNESYGFTPLVGTDWIEYDVKLYFDIPESVELRYIEGE